MSNDERSPSGFTFWFLFVVGWAVMAVGAWKIFHNVGPDNPRYTLPFALGLNIFHDAVVPPVACAVGWIVAKLAPARIRAQVGWGLFASAIVVVVGWVPLSGKGKKPDNPTILPLDYSTAVLTVLAVVWAIVALLIIAPTVLDRVRARRSTPNA